MTLEPVAVVNTIVALVEALISVAVGFGAPLTKEQLALVLAVVVAIGNLVRTLWARGQVTPVVSPRDNQGNPLVPSSSTPVR